jgi:hypothetical protein
MALNAAAGPISPLPKTKIFIMKLLLSVLLAFSPVAFYHTLNLYYRNFLFSRGGSHAAGHRAWEPGLLEPKFTIEQAHYTIVPRA